MNALDLLKPGGLGPGQGVGHSRSKRPGDDGLQVPGPQHDRPQLVPTGDGPVGRQRVHDIANA